MEINLTTKYINNSYNQHLPKQTNGDDNTPIRNNFVKKNLDNYSKN